MRETPNSRENPDKSLDRAVEAGIAGALQFVETRYEHAADTRDNLAFHNKAHTEGVLRRTKLILDAMHRGNPDLVKNRDVQIGRLAAAYHDTVQAYEVVSTSDGAFSKKMRKRFVTQNEKASADEAIVYMTSAGTVFKEADTRSVRDAIDATVPAFDPVSKTVVQPNLKNDSGLVTRAVALADIGSAGMDGPEAHLAEGDVLFREENLDIAELLKEKTPLSAEQKEYFRGRMLAWGNFQGRFAEGRKALLDSETAAIPMPAREHVKALFSKFDDSIKASDARARNRSSMTFEELARDMGYEF